MLALGISCSSAGAKPQFWLGDADRDATVALQKGHSTILIVALPDSSEVSGLGGIGLDLNPAKEMRRIALSPSEWPSDSSSRTTLNSYLAVYNRVILGAKMDPDLKKALEKAIQ